MSVVQLCCRCFMSGGAPASSPSKSRVVEAVCIRLCDAITQPLADSRPDGSPRYVSRWRQVLDAYNRVRARLFNSLELLEGTDLALFAINEATLLRWFKMQERRKEVLLLQQGRPVPVEPLCSVQPLPPSQSRPSVADPLPGPHLEFPVTSGTANCLRAQQQPLHPWMLVWHQWAVTAECCHYYQHLHPGPPRGASAKPLLCPPVQSNGRCAAV